MAHRFIAPLAATSMVLFSSSSSAEAANTPDFGMLAEAGEDYSWLQFVGMKGDGIVYSIDLYQLGPKFAVPFYMVQGQEDLLTMADQSRRYFDFIEAPRKQFVLVPAAGHDPNPPMVAAQYKLLRENFDRCD